MKTRIPNGSTAEQLAIPVDLKSRRILREVDRRRDSAETLQGALDALWWGIAELLPAVVSSPEGRERIAKMIEERVSAAEIEAAFCAELGLQANPR